MAYRSVLTPTRAQKNVEPKLPLQNRTVLKTAAKEAVVRNAATARKRKK